MYSLTLYLCAQAHTKLTLIPSLSLTHTQPYTCLFFRSIAFRGFGIHLVRHVMIIWMGHMGAFDRKTLFANRKHTTIEMTTTKMIILREMKTNIEEDRGGIFLQTHNGNAK